MNQPYHTSRRVEFRDTDAGGILHFASYLAYMESAEHEMLRHVGMSVVMPAADEGVMSWPRVSVQCDYQAPAQFEDLLDISVWIEHLGSKSVRYVFDFHRAGQALARGHMTVVCCRFVPGKSIQPIPIPDAVRATLQPFVIEAT